MNPNHFRELLDPTAGAYQAWRQSAARVTLRPGCPVPIELDVVRVDSTCILRCIVHSINALDAIAIDDPTLVPWTDLPRTSIVFGYAVPIIDETDEPAREIARLGCILARIQETAMHELDEFLLVDGLVAAPPHETQQPTIMPDDTHEGSTWHTAIGRISLHPSFWMQVDLSVEEDPPGRATISCAVRHSDREPSATICHATSGTDGPSRVQQLLALVHRSVRHLLDECLIVDDMR